MWTCTLRHDNAAAIELNDLAVRIENDSLAPLPRSQQHLRRTAHRDTTSRRLWRQQHWQAAEETCAHRMRQTERSAHNHRHTWRPRSVRRGWRQIAARPTRAAETGRAARPQPSGRHRAWPPRRRGSRSAGRVSSGRARRGQQRSARGGTLKHGVCCSTQATAMRDTRTRRISAR